VKALEALGVRKSLSAEDAAPFRGIRYLQESGTALDAPFRHGEGLGIRRIALHRALLLAAQSAGAQCRERMAVREVAVLGDGVRLETDAGEVKCRFLVCADGLASPLREKLGLAGRGVSTRRYGVRRHFSLSPWSDRVEVHWGAGVEAYVTPAGARRVGIALLWDTRAHRDGASFAELLGGFPHLVERLSGAPADSEVLGKGPLWHIARSTVASRVALLGDAAGYVDALTGEGLSLGFHSAAKLTAELDAALRRNREALPLLEYARWHSEAYRRYSRTAGCALVLARRPHLRRALFSAAARVPGIFSRVVNAALTP
jgi:2-polyprenyl-6-methoxyphenol hydroxylase-like FAD-dependent oxidoreductase